MPAVRLLLAAGFARVTVFFAAPVRDRVDSVFFAGVRAEATLFSAPARDRLLSALRDAAAFFPAVPAARPRTAPEDLWRVSPDFAAPPAEDLRRVSLAPREEALRESPAARVFGAVEREFFFALDLVAAMDCNHPSAYGLSMLAACFTRAVQL